MSDTRQPSIRILIVGGLPPPLGGCTVTLKRLVEHLRSRSDVEVDIVDTSGVRGGGLRAIPKALSTGGRVWHLAAQADVVTLHVATTGLPIWGLVVFIMARLRRKPFVARKFAGTDYSKLGSFLGAFAHLVAAKADLYFGETKAHVELSRARGLAHAQWMPTTRPVPADRPPASENRESCRRFVFIGQVRAHKGIAELAEAAEQLPPGASVDVYGPWFDDLDPHLFEGRCNIAYHGELHPDQVVQTMQAYDALVLPSKAPTEGYPGSILEAYMAGLPVIAATSGAIPEIVDSEVGILVPPGDVGALATAMRSMTENNDLYHRLRLNAYERAREFSSHVWADRFVEYCRELVTSPRARGQVNRRG